jgi:CRISPR-associated protein Csb1
LNLDALNTVVRHSAALRSRAQLTPVGGVDDKIFPPTYEGGRYATEIRRIDGLEVDCVLVDAVQSQANRFEAALQQALDRGRISIPCIRVAFPDELARELGPITSLTAPHRCYDAILRDSMLADGTFFPKSEVGQALSAVRPNDATALYRHCPTALVFGAWDSTGPRGGMGAKFSRAVSSEIVGIGATAGVHTSSRIDPLGVRSQVGVIVEGGDSAQWRLAAEGEKGAKRPSEIVHGNIAPTIEDGRGGVTVDRIEQTWVLSVPALRRYRFPIDGDYDDARDEAARAVLVALALVARGLARDDGLFLRSRCQLIPIPGAGNLEIVAADGSTEGIDDPSTESAVSVLADAVAAATSSGLEWDMQPLELQAQERLTELVARSIELAPKRVDELDA